MLCIPCPRDKLVPLHSVSKVAVCQGALIEIDNTFMSPGLLSVTVHRYQQWPKTGCQGDRPRKYNKIRNGRDYVYGIQKYKLLIFDWNRCMNFMDTDGVPFGVADNYGQRLWQFNCNFPSQSRLFVMTSPVPCWSQIIASVRSSIQPLIIHERVVIHVVPEKKLQVRIQ